MSNLYSVWVSLYRLMFRIFSLCLIVSANTVAETQFKQIKAQNWELGTPDNIAIDYYQASDERLSVLLFWATWCPNCRDLMPHIQGLASEFQSKGVDFYALNIFEDADPVAYFKKHNYSFTLLLIADLVAEDYNVAGVPALFVVDKDKTIIYQRNLGKSDEDSAADIRELLYRKLDGRG